MATHNETSGNDTIWEASAHDTFSGAEGDDTLIGAAGDDVLQGEDGADSLDGSTVTTCDVTASDGRQSNAELSFPAGENVIFEGVTPAQMSSAQLHAAGIPCFTPGAMIATPQGERAIETLQVGDRVMTRDHGLQEIRWIGQREVQAVNNMAPILIRPGVVTGQEKSLLVSPQHRMLFSGYRAELLFGESEVLIAAKHLLDGQDVVRKQGGHVIYVHMLFDSHEVVYANGAATESFHPGDEGIAGIDDAARSELFNIFPELRADISRYGQTARRCLRKHEAQMVRM